MVISLVIPIFNLCEYRLRNLAFILHHITNSELSRNVSVIEQKTENPHAYNITNRFPNVNHITYDLNQTKFNKSKLLNTHIKKIKSDYIWVYDVDVYLDVNYVLSQIPTGIQLVRPFEFIINLDEHESTYLFKSNLIKTKKSENKLNHAFGKYSFILKTDYFKQIEGYDERYEGWGFQDLDLISRLPKKIYSGYTKNIAFHMYHPSASRENYKKNKELFSKKGNFKKLIPKKKKMLDKKTKL